MWTGLKSHGLTKVMIGNSNDTNHLEGAEMFLGPPLRRC